MKNIKLIKEDFDSLDTEVMRRQYVQNYDCPIARAFKRLGYGRCSVTTFEVVTKTHVYSIIGGIDEVQAIARQLKRGTKRVKTIKVTSVREKEFLFSLGGVRY